MNTHKKHTKSEQNQAIGSEKDDFFIPDLCNAHSVLLLVVASEMFALIVAIVSSPLPHFNWMSMGLVSLLTQWVTLSSAAIVCGIRPWLRRLTPWVALCICSAVIFIDTAVFSLVGQWAVTPAFYGTSIWYSIDYWAVVQNLLISALISSMVFRYFLVQHQLRVKESAELNARLQSLQSRIRPHFLFNSMNIIASLIAVDPKRAETVVEDLSELFRASLKETANVVPLKDEIDLCKKYAGIEKLRLGKRLNVNWEEVNFSESLYQSIEIPMLLLQPLLENAIYHGIQPRPEGGEVSIKLENQETRFEVTIINPLPADNYNSGAEGGRKGNQMALNNIRHRLDAIYGKEGKLEQSEINGEFVTVLSFPKSTLGYHRA
jgi:two-component system sensor histidine kinase AlgZ